jgi:two-component system LytT family sensor kinase
MPNGNRDEPVFMNPLIFITGSVLLGLLFAFQEWYSVHKMGYQIPALIFFESWGFQFLLWGSVCWMFWRFLRTYIQRASLSTTLTLFLPLSIVISLGQQMLYVLVFQNLPPDHPEPSYWKRLSIYVDAELLNNVLIFWCAFFLFRGIGYYQRSRADERAKSELETQLANAQLAALRMQLNPHFLFNAMNSISSLMRTDVDAADNMLEQLSCLLRIALERGETQFVSLRDELDFIELYLSMQKRRYAGRVTESIEVDPELYDVLVPSMLLQPIVENAYVHGISRAGSPGTIVLQGRSEGSRMRISLVNSGIGMNPKPDRDTHGHGVGLQNLQKRLALHYRGDAGFEIAQVDSSHVQVTIVLPKQGARDISTRVPLRAGAK